MLAGAPHEPGKIVLEVKAESAASSRGHHGHGAATARVRDLVVTPLYAGAALPKLLRSRSGPRAVDWGLRRCELTCHRSVRYQRAHFKLLGMIGHRVPSAALLTSEER